MTALLPNPATLELYVIEDRGDDRWLHRLDPDGLALDAPYRFSRAFSGEGVALTPDGSQLFFSNKDLPAPPPNPTYETLPTLSGLTVFDLIPEYNIPLPSTFDDVVIDQTRNLAFAVTPFEDMLYIVDLADQSVQRVKTAIEVRDIVIEEGTGDLFVSDSANRIRRLDGETLKTISGTLVENNDHNYGFKVGTGAGELALDKIRNRLYVSGRPAFVFEADTLTQIKMIEPGGQFAFAPGADQIYLSNCGVAILDARSLISQTVIPGSVRRKDQLSPNPCVGYSRLDAPNQLLYSLAPNGVPGSNSGNLLHVYALTPKPRRLYEGAEISMLQVLPDPARQRAFVRSVRGELGRLRTLTTGPAAEMAYTQQLGGKPEPALYNPATRRLYLTDSDRLLVLDGDRLDVIGEMPLPPDHFYRLAAFDPNNSRLYLAGNDGQLLIARDDGKGASRREAVAKMSEAGLFSARPDQTPNGSIQEIHALPHGQVLARIDLEYDFQQQTRLFLTGDDGRTWTALDQSLPPRLQAKAVGVLSSRDIATPTILAAFTDFSGSTGGLYQSTNLGQSWSMVMQGLRDLAIDQVVVSPTGTRRALLLANTVHAGMHYSRDQGQTWTPVAPPDPNLSSVTANSVAAVSRYGVVLASRSTQVATLSGASLYRATSDSNGVLSTWRRVLDVPLTRLAFAPDGRTALGFAEGLWRSTDGGRTWAPGGFGLTDLDLTQASRFLFSPDFVRDQTVYLFFRDIRGDASGRLFRSTNGGLTWQIWANHPPTDGKRFTAVALTAAGEILFGDDEAQLTQLSPASFTWADPSPPTALFTIDDLAPSPNFAQDKTLFAVSHQQGLFVSLNGGRLWRQTGFPVRSLSFEGYRLALSPAYAEDQTLFVATGFSLHRSTDGGQTWQNLRLGPRRPGFKAERVALSPNFAADQTLLATTPEAIFRSVDGGDTWQLVLDRPPEAGNARLLAFSPVGDIVYAWFDYHTALFVGAQGGQRWEIRPGQADESFAVAAAAVGPGDILTLRPDFAPQLFQISNQGRTRQALDNVLPPGLSDIKTMAYSADGGLVVGGRDGLWRSSDNGQSWQALPNGPLAGADVSRVRLTETHYFAVLSDGKIFASDDEGASWQEISLVR